MTMISLKGLFHKSLSYNITLPDGTVVNGSKDCEIPVRIPQIQRDYAEGRETENVKRKRRNLLTDMIRVLYGLRNDLSFDFVYGYMMDKGNICSIKNYNDYQQHPDVVFDPLDGQQRLTTLFLFYWFFGRANDLKYKGDHSLFIYETRPTSEEFCNWLVTKDAKSIVDVWRQLIDETKKSNEDNKKKWFTKEDEKGKIDPMVNRLRYPEKKIPNFMEYIVKLEDFKWDWHDDPNIRSMIIVIESIYNLMKEMGLGYDDGIKNNPNLDNITFQLLDDLECDGDELFEKMNARGKALTHFEEIKSVLEEELETQGLPSSNQLLVTDWQNKIDGKWVDYCWNTLITSSDPTLEEVRNVERKLERLIIRMIAKTFFNIAIKHTKPKTNDALNYGEILEKSITNDMDKVIDNYVDYALHERSMKMPYGLSTIDFESVLSDIDNMLYDDCGKWKDIFQLVHAKGFHFHKDNNKTLLDDFLADNTTHNVRVMFYAIMAYLKERPASTIASNPVELDNFTEWMRFVRNVFLPENKTAGLDNVVDANKSINAVDNWLKEFFNPSSKTTNILVLIKDYIPNNNSFGQEQARLDEEAIKAELRLSSQAWNKSIIDAENNHYLWGQIIAPLSWSKTQNGLYDKNAFDRYMDKLNLVFNPYSKIEDTAIDVQFIQALLCVSDYRSTNRMGLGSLKRFKYHRDYSWKRYLRDDDGNGLYGRVFKDILDEWITNYSSKDFGVFLDDFINIHKPSVPKTDWRYFVINASAKELLYFWNNIVRTNSKHIYVSADDGHAYYFRSETMRPAIRYELLTSYLYMKLKHLNSKVDHLNGYDGAFVEFTYGADIIRVSSVSGNLYEISKNGTIYKTTLDIPTLENELIKIGVINSL